ncbi:MAG: tetratricopeptide repeat protein [Bacteroidota bacterium]
MDLTMKYNPAFLDDETLIRTFVVRHREFDAVVEVVRENTGEANQHVLVIGPRGSGKSTLVLRAAAEIRRDEALAAQWYPVVFGEESYGVTNAGEFWLEALFQIAEQTGEARWHEAHAELQQEPDAVRLRGRALAQLMDFADERGVRLLLVVENLHQLVGSQMDDDDETWALRKTLQTEPRLMLLGTATQRFDQIDDEKQALYEFFRIVHLDPLDSLDEIADLWALAGSTDTPRAYFRPVEILTGGNPRLIRILSEFAARTSFRELMENLVHLIDEHTEYFKHHLDKLAPKERKVFVALADRWDPGTARDIAEAARMNVSLASAQLKRLEERGAVRVIDQRGRTKVYQVAERLYNIYHLMRRRGQASARVRGAVRFMVRYYEGERLVPAVQALVREACGLAPEHRRDHYLAYGELLNLAEPELRARIVAETWADLNKLSDLPNELNHRVEHETNPYMTYSLESLLEIDLTTLSLPETLQREIALIERFKESPSFHLLTSLLASQDQIASIIPSSPDAHYNRGVTLSKLRRYEEAIDAYDRALHLYPNHVDALYNKSVLLNDIDRNEEALAAYDRALSLRPDDPDAHNNRGVALAHLNNFENALIAFKHSLQLRPNDPGTYNNWVKALVHLGRFDEAIESLSMMPKNTKLSSTPGLPYISVQLAAHGQTADLLNRLADSPLAPDIEPLLVALRMDLGETVDVAQEIEEVAKDILADIEAFRATHPEAEKEE